MARYTRPGVYVNETLSALQTAGSEPGGNSVACFIGEAPKGPTAGPRLVESWSDFERIYGGFSVSTASNPSYLAYGVYLYFSNGGGPCYVVRVEGSDGAVADATLVDRAGTPVNTLGVEAVNQGAWGNSIYLTVADRDANAGRFDIVVKYGGSGDDKIVERWLDLTMDDSDVRYVESVINSPDYGSTYIRVTDLDSATAAPANRPAAAAAAQLGTGVDATVAASDFPAAVDKLDQIETASLLINVPGRHENTIVGDVMAYAAARGDSFAIVDTQKGHVAAADVVNAVAALSNKSSYAAVFWPWVRVPDPASPVRGALITLAPGAAVAGAMSQVDAVLGPHAATAGLGRGRLSNVLALESAVTDAAADTLAGGNVNAIRRVQGAGFCVMGARTLTSTMPDTYITVRRMLNYVKRSTLNIGRGFLFDNNDATTRVHVRNLVERMLTDLYVRGGLKGTTPSEAFFVVCDASNNTPATEQNGELHIKVGVAPLFPLEFIVFDIGLNSSTGVSTISDTEN